MGPRLRRYRGEEVHRSVRSVSYYRGDEKSAYYHPIEGLVAGIDLDSRKVERLVDAGAMPLAKPPVLEDPSYLNDLKPLNIVQPEGVDFQVNGHEISRDHGRFRYSFHPREGLVLYSGGYMDKGKLRSYGRRRNRQVGGAGMANLLFHL